MGVKRSFDMYNLKSIVPIQFMLKEDLSNNDLNLSDIAGKAKHVHQIKVTDLPRHSRAAPSIIKKNYDLVL